MASRSAAQYWFLEHFLSKQLPPLMDLHQKRTVFSALWDHLFQLPPDVRVQCLQKLTVPMVEDLIASKQGAAFLTPVHLSCHVRWVSVH